MAESNGATARVAEELRAQIISGKLKPGVRLSEEKFRSMFGVSRSTLREAFQLLIQDRLLVHVLSRGVFVRRLSREDVADLYKLRRIVECAAIMQVKSLDISSLKSLSSAVDEAKQAISILDRDATDSANVRFHEVLVSLANCERLSNIMHRVSAEFRLVYAHVSDTSVIRNSYLNRHIEIADALKSGNVEGAALALEQYFIDAEKEVLENYID